MIIKVGDQVVEKRIVTDEDVMHFANFSKDYNPIHFIDEAAIEQGFNGKIVHGMLVGSFFSKIIGTELPGDGSVYVSQNLRFVLPIMRGEEIIIVVTVEKYLGKKRFLLSTNCYNSNEELLVEGEAEVLVKKYEE